jgi:hypothetical protein
MCRDPRRGDDERERRIIHVNLRRDAIRFLVFFATLGVVYGGMILVGYEHANRFMHAMFASLALTFVIVEVMLRPGGPR